MKPASRTKKIFRYLIKVQNYLEFYMSDSEELKALFKEHDEVVSMVEYLAIEKKRNRIRLYQKMVGKDRVVAPQKFLKRLRWAFQYIFQIGVFRPEVMEHPEYDKVKEAEDFK